jgi:AbrB family looped-hinge helix DNA binding protein
MRTTIDRAGRIVVPKPLRDALGLTGGQQVELSARDGRLEVQLAPTAMRLENRRGHVVAVPDDQMPVLTASVVRDTLEQSRR